MNIRFLIVWLALGLLTAGGCAGPNVLTDFDPSAEFSAFRTFAFAGPVPGLLVAGEIACNTMHNLERREGSR